MDQRKEEEEAKDKRARHERLKERANAEHQAAREQAAAGEGQQKPELLAGKLLEEGEDPRVIAAVDRMQEMEKPALILYKKMGIHTL